MSYIGRAPGALAVDSVKKVVSTDNAIVRFDGTTGAVQNSGVVIDDNGQVGIGIAAPKTKLDVYSSGITGGNPAASGNAIDPTVMARIGGGAVCMDFGVQPSGAQWIQCRGIGDYSLKYDLQLQPAGGNVLVTGSGGLGYGTGSGGTVTQATNKFTAVTLNKPSGRITMNNASLASGATVIFQVNNSFVTTNDTVSANAIDNTGYDVTIGWTSTGAFVIKVKNATAGALAEALQIQFNVIKGAVA